MASPSLAELSAMAVNASEPAFTSPVTTKPGGVDPLGLRQINFDLMDQVFPGLNNVARHIRPFTVVTWAWRRAATRAQELGKTKILVSDLQDFVDRIEIVYTWSQFLAGAADLPGRDVIAPIINAGQYRFGGEAWQKRRERRRNSTALSAPINYGPALKALGWVQPDAERKGALVPMPITYDAIAAFEKGISSFLSRPVFSKFGTVSVTNSEVGQLATLWALDEPTEAEQDLMENSLTGLAANKRRRDGAKLAIAASQYLKKSTDVLAVRRTMSGPPTRFVAPVAIQSTAEAWRSVQVRQAFRLALESLLYWILRRLDERPMTTVALVERFVDAVGDAATVDEWLQAAVISETGPADWVQTLENSLSPLDEVELVKQIRAVLAMSLSEAPMSPGSERDDRLPLARAAKELRHWKNEAPSVFLAHVFESWIFGQHAYWSIGRGLADARGRGKTILRLKATLEENGWTLAPGANVSERSAPEPTGDRLNTVLTLLREVGSIK